MFDTSVFRKVVKNYSHLWYYCGQTKNHRQLGGDFLSWWTRPGSNRRPIDCGSIALPD